MGPIKTVEGSVVEFILIMEMSSLLRLLDFLSLFYFNLLILSKNLFEPYLCSSL